MKAIATATEIRDVIFEHFEHETFNAGNTNSWYALEAFRDIEARWSFAQRTACVLSSNEEHRHEDLLNRATRTGLQYDPSSSSFAAGHRRFAEGIVALQDDEGVKSRWL